MLRSRPTAIGAAPWCFALLAVLTLIAFWPSYLSAPTAGFSVFHHVHAATGAAWLALLVVQPVLAVRADRQAHQVLGRIGLVVMVVLLAAFVGLSHAVLQGKSGQALAVESHLSHLRLVEAALVAGCFVLAVVHRKNTPVHARLMICTGLPLLDPVVHRIAFAVLGDWSFNYQLLTWSVMAAVLLAFIVLDRHATAGRRVFPAFLAVLSVLFIPPVFKFWTWGAPWAAWKQAVEWYARLPLTG